MHSPLKRLLAGAVVIASTLILASAAHAASWQALGTISPSGVSAQAPQVAAAPDGSMWLAWTTNTKTQIERIAPDGNAGPVLDLAGNPSYQTALVVDSSGAATVAWADQSGGVNERSVQPDGTLGTSHAVGSSRATYPLAMGIDGSDVATLAYTDPGTDTLPLWAQRVHDGAPSGSPIQISTIANERVEQAAIATNSAGDSVLTWGWNDFTDYSTPYVYGEHVRQLKVDGTLGFQHDLIGTQQYGDYTTSTVALASSGDAYLGFVQSSGPPDGNAMKVVKLSAGDALSPVGTFGNDGAVADTSSTPHIVLNSAGQAFVTWTTVDSSYNYHLVSRRIRADGTIEPPLGSDPDIVSASDPSTDMNTLTGLPDGKAMAAWLVRHSPDYPLHTAIIDPASGPGPTLPTHDSDGYSRALSEASDSNGNVFLALDRTPDLNSYSIRGAFYDVQGPTVDNLAVPNAGAPGDTLVFGESADDRSGLQGYAWDFGDGGTASGPIVTHTYGAPGSYAVTATATDKADNSSSRTQQVVVRAPAAGGGGSGPVLAPKPGALEPRLTGLHRSFRLRRNRTIALHLPAQQVDAFGSLAVRANAGHAARVVTLGSRRFPVFHGKRTTVRIKLSRRTLTLAKRHHHRLKATVRLLLTGFDGKSAGHTYHVTMRTGR